jgi:Spy/CpxP family protein refolding chaperone
MTTKRKLTVGALLLLTVINVAGLLTMGYGRLRHAHQMPGPSVADIVGQPDFMRRELGLSEQQAAQLAALREKFQVNLARLRPALQAKRAELVQLVAEAQPDRVRIDALMVELRSLQAELQNACVQQLLDEKSILTPEQQRKFLDAVRARLLEGGSNSAAKSAPHLGEGREQ